MSYLLKGSLAESVKSCRRPERSFEKMEDEMKSVRVERAWGSLVLDFELFLLAACHESQLTRQLPDSRAAEEYMYVCEMRDENADGVKRANNQ